MFGRFMPTEGKFFEYFNQHAACAVTAAHELEALVNDLPNAEAHARRVQATEKKADRVTHDTIDLLHKTFITRWTATRFTSSSRPWMTSWT